MQADDEGAEGEARRKTKKEVMEEIIAKSKMHKMLRKRCVNIIHNMSISCTRCCASGASIS